MEEGGKPGGFPIGKGDPAGDGEGQGEGDPSTGTGNAIPFCVKKWGARGRDPRLALALARTKEGSAWPYFLPII